MKTAGATTSESNWTIQSSKTKTMTVAYFFGALGLFMLWMLSQARVSPEKQMEMTSANLLGFLLIGVAFWVFLFLEDILIIVDEKRKRLYVTRTSLTGTRSSTHRFEDIHSVEVASIGRSHRGIVTHHLVISFRDGTRLPTQFWSADQSETREVAERLALATGRISQPSHRAVQGDLRPFVLSAIGAVLLYCVWYHFFVGPLCVAMWFGTAPPVIIGLSFLALYRLSRLVPYRT